MSTITRPTIAYRCIVWHGNMRRDSTTLSDGAIFANESDATAYCNRVKLRGGKIHSVREVKNPPQWYDSLEEFDRLGRMSVAELKELQAKWRAV